jgi:hypothetical protein
MRVLEAFLLHNKNTTGSQLESKYGKTAGLLLARVLAWLRCVYPSGHSCTQLLSTISIFINASNGFLAQITQVTFLHTGRSASISVCKLPKLGIFHHLLLTTIEENC